ncbi:MAG: lysophospholipid acyltransferase family protein [Desulfuromonadia bacterium]
MNGTLHYISALLYRGGIGVVSLVPFPWVDRVGGWIGSLLRLFLPSRFRVALEGLSSSINWMRRHPQWGGGDRSPRELALETFRNIGRSLLETCLIYAGKGERLIDRIEMRGVEAYQSAREKGRGVILLTAHCGNWELVALGFSRLMKTPMAVVARKQNNPHLNRLVERVRLQYDNRIIYKEGALREILKTIARNGVVGMLVDQAVIPEEGVKIDFLGRPAWCAKSPVLIARKSGVPVVPAFTHREGGRHVITFFPELSFVDDDSPQGVTENVRRYCQAIECFIVMHPTNWYWVHRRWKRA